MTSYPLFHHFTTGERETWKRIKLSVWAYAYEIADNPVATDEQFDKLAASIDLTINTKRADLDEWWRSEFQPHTGQWIHAHPELDYVRRIYERFCL